MNCTPDQSSPGAVGGRPVRQEHGEEAGQGVGHGAEGGRQVVSDRPVGQAGVGLHRGQHAVGERVHKGHEDIGEDQVGRVAGVHFLLRMPLSLTAVHQTWGAQVLVQCPDGVEGDLGGEEVFRGGFPEPGVTLEEKEGHETAGHHEGKQQEEDGGREVGGEVAAFQWDHPSEARHRGAVISLGKDKTRVVRSLGDAGTQFTTILIMILCNKYDALLLIST